MLRVPQRAKLLPPFHCVLIASDVPACFVQTCLERFKAVRLGLTWKDIGLAAQGSNDLPQACLASYASPSKSPRYRCLHELTCHHRDVIGFKPYFSSTAGLWFHLPTVFVVQ
jgi:hypothetical protein